MLDKGEEILSTISGWAKKEKITGAQVWGIGAVEDVELAAYEPEAKKWVNRKFSGSYELLSCIGNISEEGLHAHISMSGADFNAVGGHLLRAKISVFGEFFILPTGKLGRELVPSFGLRGIRL
jgi:hypothetical protein